MGSAPSRRGDYAVRAVLDLTRHAGGGRRKAREIASATDVPPRYLTQILALLVRLGFLSATAGPQGGYRLARPPSEITLREVIEAADGPFRLEICVLRGGPCDPERPCPVHLPWTAAERAFLLELAACTFEALAAGDLPSEGGVAYGAPPDAHSGTCSRD